MSRSQYPTSFRVSAWLAALNVVLSVSIALLTWMRHDSILIAWTERNQTARNTYLEQGLEGLRNSPAVPSFVPLAIVSVLVFTPLVVVLMLFLRERVNWARPLLTVTLVFAALLAVQGIQRNLPATFLVLSVLALGCLVALTVSLWWPSTTRWLRSDDLSGDLIAPEQVQATS